MSLPDTRSAITFVLTPDRPRAQKFYGGVLGLKLLAEDGFAATYDLGGGTTLRLTNIEAHKPSPHTVLGWKVPDLRAAMRALRAQGVTFKVYQGMTDAEGLWAAPGGGALVCWFDDPDGNNLSLTQIG